MKRKILTGAAIAALLLGAVGGTAGAASTPQNTACQKAGIKTLQGLGLLPAVGKDGTEVVGVGVVRFPTVLKLHRTQPSLFRDGGVSVVVPGVGTVPATWCDGV